VTTLVNIPLREDFIDPNGQWTNYDCDITVRDDLVDQKHVDIRSFVNDTISHPVSMLDLDQMVMTGLDNNTMTNLEGQVVIRPGEAWSAGVCGPQADRHNWNGISFACTPGLNTTASVMAPVDIGDFGAPSTGRGVHTLPSPHVISVALPAFDPTNYTLASCFLDLTSHPTGDFTAGPTDSLKFSTTKVPLTTGDMEASWSLSDLSAVNVEAITGVRFRLTVTANQTFRALAVRLLGSTWVWSQIDSNTLYDEGRLPVTRNGSATLPATALNPFPVIYRANGPSAQGDPADPMPIDMSVSCLFTPGSLVGTNKIALRFREMPLDEQIQLDLDGRSQAFLDTLLGQPDLGAAAFRPRVQSDLDPLIQSEIDTGDQFSIERLPDYVQDSYIEAKLQWSNTTGILTLMDANGNGYTFNDITLSALSAYRTPTYALRIDLEDNSIRAKIFALDTANSIVSVVYDTTKITDSQVFKRRKGRFGWWAQFADGDAAILRITPRKVNYASVVTHQFASSTPVEGSRLVVGASPEQELITGIGAAPWAMPLVASDPTKTNSGQAYRLRTTTAAPLQGFQSNLFRVEDIDNITITFDLFFPKAGLTPQQRGGIEAFLYGADGSITPIPLIGVKPDRWQRHRLSIPERILGGLYRFVILQTTGVSDLTWWIDRLSVKSRILTWEGRSEKPDPWEMADDGWVPYLTTLNKSQSGILYDHRGKGLQVKATAHQQDAQINSLKIVPRYAELGRFRWDDEEPTITGNPTTPTITPTISGKKVTFVGATTTPHKSIIAYYWSFGDDSNDYGPTVAHTYALAGTYIVTLVVIDDQYRQATATTTVTV
jgi:hypothetical protein